MAPPIEVFYAYAPADETWVQELEKHLSGLQRQGLITTWHPRLIVAGEDWQHVIDARFRSASVILLLISPDFLDSDYCYGAEMRDALAREREQGVCIIPILLRPVDWAHAPFAHLRPLPSDQRFLTEWSNLDRAFAEVTAGIRRAIENLSVLAAGLAHTEGTGIWNVPFPRNFFFLGRDALLTDLHRRLHQGQRVALAQALSGLGGVGKTQLAVEYAYRFAQDYDVVLWAHAESTELLTSSYIEMAGLLNLPAKEAQEQTVIVQAVKIWLGQHRRWLLILDNADALELLPPFLPSRLGGHLLITTRSAAPGRIASRMVVESFAQEAGVMFLLRRAGLLALDAEMSQVSGPEQALAEQIVQEMAGLPLALDQVGAYLEVTGCGLDAYWQQYQQHRLALLQTYRGVAADHPEPVATTWTLSLQEVQARHPVAADLLRLCAFLAPDAIAEQMLRQGAEVLPAELAHVLTDGYLLDQAIEALRAYSFVTRETRTRTLSVHRLVQTVIRETLPEPERLQWMQRAVALVNRAFPEVEFATWATCERCLPHALLAAQWIEQADLHDPAAMRVLDHLGDYLVVRGLYTQAEPYARRAATLREQYLGPDHLETALSLSHLGRLDEALGHYAEAAEVYQRARASQEHQLGPDHLDLATTLHGQADLLQILGKYAEAETLYLRVLAIREHQGGADQADIVSTFNDLGRVYERWGQYAQAETLVLRALALSEHVLGPENPQTANSLHNLALLYRRQGNYAQAEPLARRALSLHEQILGSEHPNLASPLNNLARVYSSLGRYREAEPLAQREVAMREQQLGPDHVLTSFSLGNLALLYGKLQRYAEAELLAKRAVEIRERQLGPEHPETAFALGDLAYLYTSQEKYLQAEPLCQRTLAIRLQQVGPDHPSTATSLRDLAYIYAHQGKEAEAEAFYRQALAIRTQQLGPEHPDTAQVLFDLASLSASQGKTTEAEGFYQRSIAIDIHQLGPEHPETQTVRERYTLFLQEKGNGS